MTWLDNEASKVIEHSMEWYVLRKSIIRDARCTREVDKFVLRGSGRVIGQTVTA